MQIKIDNFSLEVVLYAVDMQQEFIFGSHFCQEFKVLVDFQNMQLSLTVASTMVTVQLLREKLDFALNEVQELTRNGFDKFC